jgi:hypothetical protein
MSTTQDEPEWPIIFKISSVFLLFADTIGRLRAVVWCGREDSHSANMYLNTRIIY